MSLSHPALPHEAEPLTNLRRYPADPYAITPIYRPSGGFSGFMATYHDRIGIALGTPRDAYVRLYIDRWREPEPMEQHFEALRIDSGHGEL